MNKVFPFVRVQKQDFDLTQEIANLRSKDKSIGAVVAFIGTVRDINEGDNVSCLELEHYSGMTEKTLENIRQQANQRWDLQASLIIHRVGKMNPMDQIVLVAVASLHRENAFKATNFIMDFLKTNAPFWKKETTPEGKSRWLDEKISDNEAQKRWLLK